jgi:dipeptidase
MEALGDGSVTFLRTMDCFKPGNNIIIQSLVPVRKGSVEKHHSQHCTLSVPQQQQQRIHEYTSIKKAEQATSLWPND